METVTATTASPLTEATLNGSVVTLTLSGARYESSIFDVRDGVSVSGIAGVSVGTFGVQRVSDTKATVTLTFNGDFDADGTLTFTVGADAISNYNGSALTAQLPGKRGNGNGDGNNGITVNRSDAEWECRDADTCRW